MNDILDIIWFLIKVIGSLTILTFLCSLFIAIITDMARREQDRKRNKMLDEAITQAIKSGNFQAGLMNTNDEDNKK